MINTDIILILTSIVGLISLVWIVHSLPMWGKFHDNGVGREGQFGQGGHIEHEHDIEEDKEVEYKEVEYNEDEVKHTSINDIDQD